MLHPDTLSFLTELMTHNDRDWFASNKHRWEEIKKSFLEYTQSCIDAMVKLDPSLSSAQASRCMYRIYRDVRFSNDKRPYKAHLSFFIPTGGVKRTGVPGYFVQFDPEGGSFIGGGIFMPEAPAINAIRQEIFYNPDEFKTIVEDSTFRQWFPDGFWDPQPLKIAPKGYPKDWEHIEWLNHRNWCTMRHIPIELMNSRRLEDETLECFRATVPLNKFLQKAMYELL